MRALETLSDSKKTTKTQKNNPKDFARACRNRLRTGCVTALSQEVSGSITIYFSAAPKKTRNFLCRVANFSNTGSEYGYDKLMVVIFKDVIFMPDLSSDYDLHLFHEGRNFQSYRFLGAHCCNVDGRQGVRFAVWAPNASAVYVVGDFNNWQAAEHAMQRISGMGVWMLFIPALPTGSLYKYEIHTPHGGPIRKADPFGFSAELRPGTASKVVRLDDYEWEDERWQKKQRTSGYDKPVLIYELHAGSWRKNADGTFFTYRQLADELAPYAADMGYTHVELMPLSEHPLDASWGYQVTGYFAVTSRYGTPQDLMYFVDTCHAHGVGVILDWAPGHFCKDDQGLRMFDGTPLYEHWHTGRAENYGWGTLNFDFSVPEVRSFLISNALFWFEQYHIDGLRVDAVANMLYLDYGKKAGEWTPNQYGGRENIDAINFIRQCNEAIFASYPQAIVAAEESTAWPLVTRPTYVGGLGFNYKWNMGWMNDSLRYMALDPIYRQYEHHLLTFSLMYAFSENYMLPLSHDEVVHGKRSLLDKMPGDYWQKFANLRAFYGYWMAHPGKKLLFMGGEFGQFIEWNENESLDWHLLDYDAHRQLQQYVKALNHLYRQYPCLWQQDCDWAGFEWIDCHDYHQSVFSFLRRDKDGKFLIVICNFTPVVRYDFRLGVPERGNYREIFNSDRSTWGGSDQINDVLTAQAEEWHGRPYSLHLKLPPLAAVFLAWDGDPDKEKVGEEDAE